MQKLPFHGNFNILLHQHHLQCDLDQHEALPPSPSPCTNRLSENEANPKEKRQDSGDSKVSIRLVQNILIDNIQDVSKPVVNVDTDGGIKILSISLRNVVRAILGGLVLCGDCLKRSNYQPFKELFFRQESCLKKQIHYLASQPIHQVD